MELRRERRGDALELRVSGRLDAYWAGELETQLGELERAGEHRLRLHLGEVTFLSSAGIRVLIRYARQLGEIGGGLAVVEPSPAVREVLELSGLSALLSAQPEVASDETLAAATSRELVAGGVRIRFEGQPQVLPCRLLGDPAPLARAAFTAEQASALAITPETMAVGLGGLGDDCGECRGRFGEFLAAGGVAIAQPTGSEASADFLAGAQAFVPTVQVLYALTCTGEFPLRASFEPAEEGGEVALVELAEAALEIAGTPACALVVLAEVAGLVGAALKRSPATGDADTRLFAHPEVREWLSFTSEPAHEGALALVAGVAARAPGSALAGFVRPLAGDGSPSGHFHAAALSYRALPRTTPDLAEIVPELLATQSLAGVLHLLPDLRGLAGVGGSSFVRGALWLAPVEIAGGTG